MSYSSYTDYLKYKNCKRDTIPCYNNFESYHKYTRSLGCCRAWWTNDNMKKLIAVTPCKMCLAPPQICKTNKLSQDEDEDEDKYTLCDVDIYNSDRYHD